MVTGGSGSQFYRKIKEERAQVIIGLWVFLKDFSFTSFHSFWDQMSDMARCEFQ